MFVSYNWAEVPAPEYDGEYLLDPEYVWNSVEKDFSDLLDALGYVSSVFDRLITNAGRIILDGIGIYADDGMQIGDYYWEL